jgi:hypothetical protein
MILFQEGRFDTRVPQKSSHISLCIGSQHSVPRSIHVNQFFHSDDAVLQTIGCLVTWNFNWDWLVGVAFVSFVQSIQIHTFCFTSFIKQSQSRNDNPSIPPGTSTSLLEEQPRTNVGSIIVFLHSRYGGS